METDVIVIGGGLAGAATAFHLSKSGARVTLLEKDRIAYGASGRNGGQVIQLDGRDKDLQAILKRIRYSQSNIKLLMKLKKELEIDFEFQQIGSVDLAYSEEECEELKEICVIQKEGGDAEVEFLDRKDLREVFPLLTNSFYGARYRKTDGNINPINLTYGLINKSRKFGTRVFTGCEVNNVLVEAGKVKGVETNNDTIKGETVVLATSAWTKDLFPEIKIFPLRSLAVVTEKIPKIRVPAFEVVIGNEIYYGATQFKTGNVLVGGPPDRPRTFEEQYDYSVTWPEYVKNVSIIERLFPKLRKINVIRCWAGTMATTPDGLPLVGKSSIAEGLYIIAGFPNGMAFIPFLAKLLSQLIIYKKVEMDLDIFDPDRFNELRIEWPTRYNYTIIADFLGRL